MTAPTITLFANLTTPTGPQLDNNFLAYAVFCNIPCAVTGTNSIVMTQNANTPALTQLTNFIQFSGVFANTNSGPLTIAAGGFAPLACYKDSPNGPIAFAGGECVAGNAFSARYDSGLPGYHVTTATSYAGGTITGPTQFGTVGPPVTRIISGLGTLAYSITAANSTQDQHFTLAGVQLGDSLAIGWLTAPITGMGFTGFMAAAGTIGLRAINPTAGTIGAATLTVRATAIGFT